MHRSNSLSDIGLLTIRAEPVERQMIVGKTIAARRFQLRINVLHQRVLELHLCAALPADQVMMPGARQLVSQVPRGFAHGPCEAVARKEIERAVDGRLGQAGKLLAGKLIDLCGSETSARMP